jgi:hypothetical protein
MKAAVIILFTLIYLPAQANSNAPVIKNSDTWLKGQERQNSPVNESINRWYRGNSAKEAPAVPLLKRTRDLSVLWVTGQVSEKEFCREAEPLRVEIRNAGKSTESDFKAFLALWSWCR